MIIEFIIEKYKGILVMNKLGILFFLPLSLIALSMKEMVQVTLDKNPNMQKEISNYRAINYDLDKAKSGWKPNVDFNADIGLEHNKRDYSGNSGGLNEDATNLVRTTAGIVATENLFEGFATDEDIKEKKSRITSSRYQVLQSANTLALKSSEVYIEVLRQKSILDLAEENVKAHERIYTIIRERTEAGSGLRSDVEQAEGRLALSNSNYISQLNNYQDSIINFERVYGKIYTASSLETPESPALPGSTYEELWRLAQKYNPTLLLERSNINVQESRLAKDKSNFYPTVDLELSADMANNVQGYKGTNTGARGLVKISYNLYRGGNDELARLQNLEYITVQKESLNEQQRAVREKLKLAWYAKEITYRQIRCIRLHVKYTKMTLNSYTEEYQLGRRSIIDLLNGELEHNEAKTQLANAQSDVLFAHYRVLEAMGLLTFSLKTDISKHIDIETPKDLSITLSESNVLDVYGADENSIELSKVCRGNPKPLKIEQVIPEIEEIVVAVSSDTIAVEEVVEYMKEDSKPVIMNSLTFKFRSNELSKEGVAYLHQIAEDIKKDGDYIVEISGHTDSKGSNAYNQVLSEKRANAAKQVLIQEGVKLELIVAIGDGELKPIASNKTQAGRAKNRQIGRASCRERV